MFCPHCNAYLEKKSKFCPDCGGDLSEVQFGQADNGKQDNPKLSSDNHESRKKYYIAGGLVFIAFLICLYGPNQSTKEDIPVAPAVTTTEKRAEPKLPAEKIEAVSLDKSFSAPSVAEMTIKSTEFTDKVEPTNPDSFYKYYKADEGKVYFVASGILKNLKKEKEDMDNLVRIEAVYGDGYKYSCMLLRDRRGNLDGLYEYIDPLQPENVKIAVELPAEAATNTLPIKIIFDFSTKKYALTVR